MEWSFPLKNIVDWWSTILAYLPLLIKASGVTLEMTFLTVFFACIIGLIAVLMKISPFAPLRWIAQFYIWFIRGTPLLVQIFIIFFGLPELGIRLPAFFSGALALAIHSGAYIAEVIRGGLLSIPKGQRESALAIGMTYRQTMQLIILPQVIRVILPPMTNQVTLALMLTSLLSTITIMELTLRTTVIVQSTYRFFVFYVLCALLYLMMTSVLVHLIGILENRYKLQS